MRRARRERSAVARASRPAEDDELASCGVARSLMAQAPTAQPRTVPSLAPAQAPTAPLGAAAVQARAWEQPPPVTRARPAAAPASMSMPAVAAMEPAYSSVRATTALALRAPASARMAVQSCSAASHALAALKLVTAALKLMAAARPPTVSRVPAA